MTLTIELPNALQFLAGYAFGFFILGPAILWWVERWRNRAAR